MRDDDSGSEPLTLGNGKAVRETAKAMLVYIGDKEMWIPKSVIHDDSEVFSLVNGENEGAVIVKRWWAEKGGYA